MSRPLEDWSYSDDFDALELSAPDRAVARYLCWRISSSTGWWYESAESIASKVGCSSRTVRRALDALEQVGGMERRRRRNENGYLHDYIVAFPSIHEPNGEEWAAAAPVEHLDSQSRPKVEASGLSVQASGLTDQASGLSGRAVKRKNEGRNEGEERGDDADVFPIGETGVETFSSEVANATPRRDDVERLLDILDAEIVRNGSKAPRRNKANRDAMRLMIDRDGRTPGQIARAIYWCQHDDFWRANILSAVKLREKYDQLRLDAARKQQPQSSRKGQRQERNLDVVAELANIQRARERGLEAAHAAAHWTPSVAAEQEAI
ncbi:hypothetical protein [Microbacterium rhizosphaerae]|uniref:Helix-turn-helix domain-containing protein n=1 Tax=Microbacterium rhizosphaerae TaxID=1678237 RepID=A0ABZ0SM90_9MICO|nr:hypothetical protein [Microbacterium rhizosphaerae]WPR88387.1 hypothetical protein SM116_11420 [Microbacterium rhizosphaerae]